MRVLGITLLLTGCSYAGNGDIVTEGRTVAAFDLVENAGKLPVEVTFQEAEQGIEVQCDSNLMEYIRTDVNGGELVIRVKGGTIHPTDDQCVVRVSTDTLSALRGTGSGTTTTTGVLTELRTLANSGSGAVTAKGIDTSAVVITLSGSGPLNTSVLAQRVDFKNSGSGRLTSESVDASEVSSSSSGSGGVELAAILADDAEIETSGSGPTTAEGVSGMVHIEVRGSGGNNASALQSTTATVRNSGSGRLSVYATESVEGELTGSGGIHVYGDPPQSRIDDSGSGSVVYE